MGEEKTPSLARILTDRVPLVILWFEYIHWLKEMDHPYECFQCHRRYDYETTECMFCHNRYCLHCTRNHVMMHWRPYRKKMEVEIGDEDIPF